MQSGSTANQRINGQLHLRERGQSGCKAFGIASGSNGVLCIILHAVPGQPLNSNATNKHRQQVSAMLEGCESLCSDNPGTLVFLRDDIEKAKGLLNGGTVYTFVSTKAKRQVYEAMTTQFSGTGHWVLLHK